MDCQRAQDCMERYFDGSIAEQELEAFISHVRECNSCREELEIYYIVELAQNYLADETELSYNISQLVEDDMNKRMEKKHRRKMLKTFLYFVYVIVLGVAIAGICMVLGYI